MLSQEIKIIKPLGQGGFGETSLVERGGDRYVLKRLKKSAIADHGDTAVQLFVQESGYLRDLGKHPQIPAFVDSGIDADGPWILQQYIPGENLEQILATQFRFTETEIINLLKSLLPVVNFIHENQAIHRDIKPANIIWYENQYYLVDFGASKRVSETVLLKTGTTIGSAFYAAPEQTVGKAVFASDIYSLGVTCAHLLTGIDPINLINTGLGQLCWRDFLQTSESEKIQVSEGFGLILDKMIEHGTYRRYQSVDQVVAALEQIDRRAIARQRVAHIAKIAKHRQISKWGKRAVISVGASVVVVGAGFAIPKLVGMIHLPTAPAPVATAKTEQPDPDVEDFIKAMISLVCPISVVGGVVSFAIAAKCGACDEDPRPYVLHGFIMIATGILAPHLILSILVV
jgi:serine/threonine protein kinase